MQDPRLEAVNRRRLGWPAGLALNALAFALLIGASFWWPLWRHHHPGHVPVPPAVAEAHRAQPDERVLDVVAQVSMLTDHPPEGPEAVDIARRLLAGEFAWPHFAPVPIDPAFSPADLERGPPVIQLWQASLAVPEMLLRAWDHTRDDVYRRAASRYLEAFVRHEAALQFPTGMLHNSHALANRAGVLTHYWRAVRGDPAAFPTAAAVVHEHAARVGALLADPAHFVAGTNHGVMQNVALLQLSVAFPRLEGAARWRGVALERFAQQRGFWLSPEGLVLEHAAGYHFHGVVLLGHLQRLLQAAAAPVPDSLITAYRAALAGLATLQRPDRTLPAYGNTYRYAWRLPRSLGVDDAAWEQSLAARPSFTRWYPTAGQAVWWTAPAGDSPGSHTFVPWGHFPLHGHRRAQEMSLLVWADGRAWSTNTGYWPGQDFEGTETVAGWAGGNAPHVVGEGTVAPRQTQVLAQADAEGLRFLDLERRVDQGPTLRRQIVQLGAGLWFVLDQHADPAGRPMRVLWTADPELAMRPLGEDAFRLGAPDTRWSMQIDVTGGSPLDLKPLQGSRDPFGGWVAFDRRAWPAPALDVRAPRPGTWVMTRLALLRDTSARLPAPRIDHRSPDDWSVEFGGASAAVQTLRRQGRELVWTTGAAGPAHERRVALAAPPGDGNARRAIDAARVAAGERFPRFRTLEPQRAKASWALGALGAAVVVGVVLTARWRPRWRQAAWATGNLAWLAVLTYALRELGR